MKTFVQVLGLAVAAAAIHFFIIGVLMYAGIGPYGRSMRLVTSGAMSSYNEATSRAWFQAAEQSVMLDRYVLWPATFFVASILCVRFVPKARWWHSSVIACAVLPLSVPEAVELGGLHLPGSPAFPSWAGPLVELLAYSLLVGLLSYLARKAFSHRVKHNEAV